MHFALPPRKTSNPPPFARPTRTSRATRIQQLKFGATILLGISAVLYLLSWAFGTPGGYAPAGTPGVVIVTLLDPTKMSEAYTAKIKENREDYAKRHGYATFFANNTAYPSFTNSFPTTWALLPALQHAMTHYPYSSYFFSLSPHALIMSPSTPLKSHVLAPSQLSKLMIKDLPVVPPDSVIHTFSHIKADKIDLILTQDAESLSHGSFILKQGPWARFFLDSWGDLLYRKYNFQKAEKHALEHIVQWHPTVLAKLALVPQRTLNSYSHDLTYTVLDKGDKNNKAKAKSKTSKTGTYQEGDFLVRFPGCEFGDKWTCEAEFMEWWPRWKAVTGGAETAGGSSEAPDLVVKGG